MLFLNLEICPCPLESHQAEEEEATQAVPVGEGREWAEPGNHLLSRHTKREEDGPTEDNIEAACRLRWDPGTYSEDWKSSDTLK